MLLCDRHRFSAGRNDPYGQHDQYSCMRRMWRCRSESNNRGFGRLFARLILMNPDCVTGLIVDLNKGCDRRWELRCSETDS